MIELEFAALMCSRLCHDLISPVAALSNGLEVLEDEDDAEMQAHAMRVIKLSAAQASAKLAFARMAFGASASAGAMIDMTEAEKVSRELFDHHKAELHWEIAPELFEKDIARSILNLLLIAGDTAPRGGDIRVYGKGVDGPIGLGIAITSEKVILPESLEKILNGHVGLDELDPRGVQPFLTVQLIESVKAQLDIQKGANSLTFTIKRAS